MATVTLVEDPSKQASTKLKAGKGIQELLYFPRVPENLEANIEGDDNCNYIEQIWVLEEDRLKLFETEIEKYDNAAAKLQEAREQLASANTEDAIENAEKALNDAQQNMRNTLVKGFNKEDKDVTPLPIGSGENLIECIGFINKRLYYISVNDLKKVENKKGRKRFRFKNNAEQSLFEAAKESTTDSSTGQTDEKLEAQQSEKDKKKKKIWKAFKKEINKEWKFYENETEGTLKLKRLERYIPNKLIQDVLKETDVCTIVDDIVEYANNTYNFSEQQKEQKREKIKEYLEKSNDDFTHYHWGQVRLLVQQIWGKTDDGFVREFILKYEDVPLKESKRQDILKHIYNHKLPQVTYDTSGGAQFMRYSANCGGNIKLDFAEGNASVYYGAEAKLALAEAGAEYNKYFPHNNGTRFAFEVPVREECYEQTVISEEYGESKLDPMFAHDSSFLLPAATIDATEQLKGLVFTKESLSPTELLIQPVGHTDTTGSIDYNEKLGYRRAKSLHALFTGDISQWLEYFQRKFWKDEEREMMRLSIYMLDNYPVAFKKRFEHMSMNNRDDLKAILKRELDIAIKDYDYPYNATDSEKIMPISSTSKSNLFSTKESDIQLIRDYQQKMRDYAIDQVGNITDEHLSLFYIDTEMHPISSKGETTPKEDVLGRNAVNRRVSLRAIGVEKSTQTVPRTINLGDGRLHIKGQVSCFVGATIGMSSKFELNTHMGDALLVGKKKEDDVVARYNDKKEIEPDEDLGPGNITATTEAFVGAKAEGSLSAALEWKNPEKTTEGFGLLASVGGTLTGTAGAGIEGEFRIGFDQKSKTFQVKMKAQATWGIGGGGSWSLSIGVQQLYDFIVLVYHKLKENNFDFVDIFENVKNKQDGKFTESRINVYEVYLAWVNEMWQQKEYFKASVAAFTGAHAIGAFNLLEKFDKLVKEYRDYQLDKEKTEHLVNNILAKPKMLKYIPPKVKGRMLFMMATYKNWRASSLKEWQDPHYHTEEAAMLLIESIDHAREFKEVMEHMAIRANINQPFECYDEALQKENTDIKRMQDCCLFLRNTLLNDYDDIMRVRKHMAKIKNWDMAWSKKFK